METLPHLNSSTHTLFLSQNSGNFLIYPANIQAKTFGRRSRSMKNKCTTILWLVSRKIIYNDLKTLTKSEGMDAKQK